MKYLNSQGHPLVVVVKDILKNIKFAHCPKTLTPPAQCSSTGTCSTSLATELWSKRTRNAVEDRLSAPDFYVLRIQTIVDFPTPGWLFNLQVQKAAQQLMHQQKAHCERFKNSVGKESTSYRHKAYCIIKIQTVMKFEIWFCVYPFPHARL